ncbi:unnamed protein product [Caenorhabditis brenneri]
MDPPDKKQVKYACHLCSFRTNQQPMFEKHLVAHESKEMFHCDGCDQQFTQKANLVRHKNQQHVKTRRLQCRYCEKWYYRRDQLNEHMMTHIKKLEMEFQCPVKQCGMRFNKWIDLTGHMDIHLITPENRGECKKCCRNYNKSRHLLVHFFADHNGDETEINGPSSKKRKIEASWGVEESDQSSEFLKNLLSFSNPILGGQGSSQSSSLLSQLLEIPPDPIKLPDMELMKPSGFLNKETTLPHNNTPLLVDTTGQYMPVTGPNSVNTNTMEDTLLKMLIEVQKSMSTSPVLSQADTTSPSLSPGSTLSDALCGAKQEDMPSSSTGVSSTYGNSPIEPQPVLGLPDFLSIFQQMSQNPILSPNEYVKSEEPESVSSTSASVDKEEQLSKMEEFIHKCEPCGMLFDDLIMFKLHCKLHSEDTPFKCGLCLFEAENKYGFLEHLVIAPHNMNVE